MCRVSLFSFVIVIVVGMMIVEGSNITLAKRVKKGFLGKKLKKDFKRLKKQEGALKLVDGDRGIFEGNVEILHNGKWGNICDDEWDESEAKVVCRQLGFDRALRPTTNGHFGQARRRFWMDNVYCDGSEEELANCRFDGWSKTDCESGEAAGVICLNEKEESWSESTLNFVKMPEMKMNIKQSHQRGMAIRLSGGRSPSEGRLEINLENSGPGENIASVTCSRNVADLVFDHIELMRTAHLEDRPLYWLQCAMEENCLASQAYKIQKESDSWHLETRRLLRFTARTLNAGTADFRPAIPKHLWEWHMCHMHYHSMEVFATFDIIDSHGKRVAEGHKASFCLEDNQCMPGVQRKYKCANYGDQGISVNCSDIYKYNIDCQWVDISELEPGLYTFKVAVNPEFKVGEMSFDNNAAVCHLLYTGTSASVHSCVMARP
ncbi:lysyl oxidase homolog 3A-like isoform X3 [Belonocnema kinseyi]|uniref:lysyl oxidase homolog 3A-like isoform X3 n=1 Tax=Belonocnema kinseyi TaxID=2817044 RepID=UPI00143D71E4|nr:lysyl oxidase homolog 3A-like isoform X3 [Belonocnema kinseyi]